MNKKLVLIPVLAFILSACSPQGNKPTTQPPGPEKSATVVIQNFAYSPKEITVMAGQPVSFTNKDTVAHSLTSDDGTSFDTGLVAQNQSKIFTAPATSGKYPFHCTPHPGIKGTLIVE